MPNDAAELARIATRNAIKKKMSALQADLRAVSPPPVPHYAPEETDPRLVCRADVLVQALLAAYPDAAKALDQHLAETVADLAARAGAIRGAALKASGLPVAVVAHLLSASPATTTPQEK